MKTIAIIGAAGRLGDAATHAFLDAGWRVVGVARGASLGTIAKGAERREADAMDADQLIAACEGADVILHALNPPYHHWPTTVLPFVRNVIAAAKAAGAPVLVPGNVYNYGATMGLDADEGTPFRPSTEKGEIRVEMEALFKRAANEDGVKTAIVRAGDFFGGTRNETWFDLMVLKDLRKNRFAWPGPYNQIHAFAYLPDLAATFVSVADKLDELPIYSTWHLEGYSVTGDEVHAAAQRVTGRTLKKGHVPWWLLRMVAAFNPLLREVIKMKYLWDVPHSMNQARLEQLIGSVPHTPLDDALRKAIIDLDLDDLK